MTRDAAASSTLPGSSSRHSSHSELQTIRLFSWILNARTQWTSCVKELQWLKFSHRLTCRTVESFDSKPRVCLALLWKIKNNILLIISLWRIFTEDVWNFSVATSRREDNRQNTGHTLSLCQFRESLIGSFYWKLNSIKAAWKFHDETGSITICTGDLRDSGIMKSGIQMPMRPGACKLLPWWARRKRPVLIFAWQSQFEFLWGAHVSRFWPLSRIWGKLRESIQKCADRSMPQNRPQEKRTAKNRFRPKSTKSISDGSWKGTLIEWPLVAKLEIPTRRPPFFRE